MKPLPRATHLIELVQSVYKLFEIRARGKNLDYQLVTETRHPNIMIDTVLLKSLVSSLLNNAITIADHGSVRLLLRELPDTRQEDYGRFAIEVSHSGPEMSEAGQTQLPEPFVQESPVVSQDAGGQLSFCKNLARSLNAHLSIDCQPGAGSRSTLIFEAPRAWVSPQQTPPELPARHRLKILVVQDSLPYSLLLCHQLELLGHEAMSCTSAEVALAAWDMAVPAFDLTMIDCNMPHMLGYELAGRIRKLEQEFALRSHPIVGLADSDCMQVIAQCLNAGMTHCLLKPTGIEALMPLIAEVTLQSERRSLAAATESGGELQKIKVLNPNAYRLLVGQILKSHREEAVKLAQLVEDGDLSGLAKMAHKLLGGARLADERALIETCIALEELTSKGSMQSCKVQAEALLRGLKILEERLLQDR